MSTQPPRITGLALATPAVIRDSDREIDHAGVQRAARELLGALGADVDSEALQETPRRVADWLERELQPKGVGVVLEAEHLCMSLRGVQKFGSRTVTSALRGLVRDDARTRQEFLALTRGTANEQ